MYMEEITNWALVQWRAKASSPTPFTLLKSRAAAGKRSTSVCCVVTSKEPGTEVEVLSPWPCGCKKDKSFPWVPNTHQWMNTVPAKRKIYKTAQCTTTSTTNWSDDTVLSNQLFVAGKKDSCTDQAYKDNEQRTQLRSFAPKKFPILDFQLGRSCGQVCCDICLHIWGTTRITRLIKIFHCKSTLSSMWQLIYNNSSLSFGTLRWATHTGSAKPCNWTN